MKVSETLKLNIPEKGGSVTNHMNEYGLLTRTEEDCILFAIIGLSEND